MVDGVRTSAARRLDVGHRLDGQAMLDESFGRQYRRALLRAGVRV